MYIYTHTHSILSRIIYTGPSALFRGAGGGDDLGDDVTPRYEARDDVTPRDDGVSPRSEVRIYICILCMGLCACKEPRCKQGLRDCEVQHFFFGAPRSSWSVSTVLRGWQCPGILQSRNEVYDIHTHIHACVLYRNRQCPGMSHSIWGVATVVGQVDVDGATEMLRGR